MDSILPSSWTGALVAVAVFLLSRQVYLTTRRRHPLPPGPKGYPFIGNALDMPSRDLGRDFRDLCTKYGTYKAVYELLEVRSAVSSDRPVSPMAELTGISPWDFAHEGYNDRWRTRRRAFHQLFYTNAIKGYRPTQLRHTQRFLQKLAEHPDDFTSHVRHVVSATHAVALRSYFGSTIMNIVYGIQTADDENDKYLVMARKTMDVATEFLVPGRYMVEVIHSLRYLPSWFPGAGFKRWATSKRKVVLAMRDVPFDAVKEDMANGTARPSIAASLLEKQAELDDAAAVAEHEEVSRDITALAYVTGADTTFSSVVAFFLAMTNFPEVQAKAQAELDAVVGPERLPHFDDRPSLPYIDALVKECLRWHVVVPLSLPHRTTEDEVYNGYFIPKGTLILSNTWALSRDPEEYPDPEAFRPERFLNPKTRDPTTFIFGAGRRVCAGRHFADASLFIIVASVLHTLSIEPPLDALGKPVKPEPKVTTHMLLSYPKPFKCRIKPRSAQAETLIWAEGLVHE
ncbi:CyP450 monooxygenase [Trametes maxima]|nr:CyP450 monooxygenase [Trametes maxima]